MSTDTEQLYAHPLFAGCDRQEADAVIGRGEIMRYRARQIILREGEKARHIFVLWSGIVRVLIPNKKGGAFTAKIFTAPAVFGEMETLTRSTFIESVEALRAAAALRFTHAAFERIMAEHGRITRNLLLDVCNRFRTAAQNQAFSAVENVECRLANLLLAFARTFGIQVAEGVQIVTDTLTAKSMASSIGVNEKSVRRTLERWIKRGWVLRPRRHFILHDSAALSALVGKDPPRLDYSSHRS